MLEEIALETEKIYEEKFGNKIHENDIIRCPGCNVITVLGTPILNETLVCSMCKEHLTVTCIDPVRLSIEDDGWGYGIHTMNGRRY